MVNWKSERLKKLIGYGIVALVVFVMIIEFIGSISHSNLGFIP